MTNKKQIEKGSNIVVWFSCGSASAVACKKIIENHSDCNIRIVNNPIKEEHEDNRRFLKDVEKWLNKKIEICVNPEVDTISCKDIWQQRKYMSGVNGAPCTMILKKGARLYFEENNVIDWHVLGFTFDEEKRAKRFIKYERSNMYPILVDLKITKDNCFKIIQEAGIDLPYVYKLGFPNANCIGCVKSTSPTYWNRVRKCFPDIFQDRAEQSRRIGAKLVRVKGKRKFLDELKENELGRPLKKTGVECGIFCEENHEQ